MVSAVDTTVRVFVVLVMTFSLASLLSALLERRVLPLGSVGATTLTRKFVYWMTVLAGLVVVLRMIGVEVAPLVAALGVGSLAVGLALQPTLTNVFAGFNLSLARRIRCLATSSASMADRKGRSPTSAGARPRSAPSARAWSWCRTRSWRNSSSPTTRCPRRRSRSRSTWAVSYGADLAHVERILLGIAHDVLANVPGGVPGFEPIVRFKGFGEFALPVMCILRARSSTPTGST